MNFDGSVQFTHRNVFGKRTMPAVRANVWTHIAASYEAATREVNIYINGSRVTKFSEVDPFQDNLLSSDWSEYAAIGRLGYGTVRSTRRLRGVIDEFYIYPCSLSTKQVNEVKDKKCIPSKSIHSLFMYSNVKRLKITS